MIAIFVGIFAFLIGYALAAYLIARDADLVRLSEDEIVVKRPAQGMVLVAVPPHVMRKLVTNPEGFEPHEARAMAQRNAK